MQNTTQKMIENDALKTIGLALVSIFSWLISGITNLFADIPLNFMPFAIEPGIIDIILERGARTVAILAGVMAILKGFDAFKFKRKNKKNE